MTTIPRTWLQLTPAAADELSISLTVTKLTNPLTDTIYSYLSSKTVFRPYQFRPVLRMLESPRQRLLIADEVGLGKTIEAGLIWTELEARDPHLRRVLIVCPAALVPKWRAEMLNRFDRDVRMVDTPALKDLLELLETGDDRKPFLGVVSIERLRASKLLADLSALHPRFDLVIVDEAHYLRNVGTLSHEMGQLLSDWADALVFLSATPLNLGTDDLFNLVHLLAEDEFSDRAIFDLQLEPNRVLNRVAANLLAHRDSPRDLLPILLEVAPTALGEAVIARPEFVELCSLLGQDSLSWDHLERTKRLLAELNTLSSVLTRTRKVDVPEAKAVREPVQIDVEWTDAEHRFYQAVLSWARQRARALGHVPGFATQMPLRQAASCLPVMRRRLLDEDPSLYAADLTSDDLDDLPLDDLDDAEELEWSQIRQAALQLGDVDTKLDAFIAVLEETERWGSAQILVFSFFRKTLAYLEEHLGRRWRVRTMHGGTRMPDRQQIMDDFRAGEFDILLASEVASEGLDFEFCRVIVNYDMPWNPMKVEQRIGRIDRFGQKNEKISVVNFHVPGTIETDIFERLFLRIRVFEESIGELEPILRDHLAELTKAALDPDLTDEQRQRRMNEIAVAVEGHRADLDDLHESEALLAGIDRLLIDGFEQDTTTRGRFVGPWELRILLDRFFADGTSARLRVRSGRTEGEVIGDGELADRVSRLGGRTGSRIPIGRLTAMLRDGEPIPITFDNEKASVTAIELISFRHPLVKAAVRWFAEKPNGIQRYGMVALPEHPAGEWLAVIYLVQTTGLRPSLELWPVAVALGDLAVDDSVGFAVLAQTARGELGDGLPLDTHRLESAIDVADQELNARQIKIERDRRQSNEALVDARIAAQRASIEAKVRRTWATLAKVTNQNLVRLHRGRIANLENRLTEVVAELDGRRQLAVTSHPVAVIGVTGTGHATGVSRG